MKRVLVSGGAGYIGAHACKALAMAGFEPVVYDNLSSGHAEAVRWGPLERGDILDRARLNEVFKIHAPVGVLHFAAHAYVGESVSDPGKYYRNNVVGSLTLIETACDHGVKNFVFSSTCATYGEPETLPISEDVAQNPINPYGASKAMVERILADFGRSHGLRSIALRYFNAAGADPDGEIGERHDPETHLIPLVLDAASGRRGHISVFGTDYPTDDGTCVRDYIHVADLAAAHVQALQLLLDGHGTDVFNLGNGTGFSVTEVINSVERCTGCTVATRMEPRREGDPAALVSDARKAKEVLGWKPRYPSIDDMVRSAWSWHQRGPRPSAGAGLR